MSRLEVPLYDNSQRSFPRSKNPDEGDTVARWHFKNIKTRRRYISAAAFYRSVLALERPSNDIIFLPMSKIVKVLTMKYEKRRNINTFTAVVVRHKNIPSHVIHHIFHLSQDWYSLISNKIWPAPVTGAPVVSRPASGVSASTWCQSSFLVSRI